MMKSQFSEALPSHRLRTLFTAAAVGFLGVAAATSKPWLTGSELSRAIPTETDPISEIPTTADVVVIGGGISGITTAMFLNQFGLRTVVFEKGYVAGEASSRNYGWVYTNGLHPDRLPLAVSSKNIWLGLAQRFGFDVTLRQNGNTLLLENEQEIQEMREWAETASTLFPEDMTPEILTGEALYQLIPQTRGRCRPRYITPPMAQQNPRMQCPS